MERRRRVRRQRIVGRENPGLASPPASPGFPPPSISVSLSQQQQRGNASSSAVRVRRSASGSGDNGRAAVRSDGPHRRKAPTSAASAGGPRNCDGIVLQASRAVVPHSASPRGSGGLTCTCLRSLSCSPSAERHGQSWLGPGTLVKHEALGVCLSTEGRRVVVRGYAVQCRPLRSPRTCTWPRRPTEVSRGPSPDFSTSRTPIARFSTSRPLHRSAPDPVQLAASSPFALSGSKNQQHPLRPRPLSPPSLSRAAAAAFVVPLV
ncbi:hypothetical protein CDD83_995 [Cordyceps sp. RAO-2017]|nr:hypothetical protein CDD83_995 [Cordyceps sp. RAO-2017]